MTSTFLELITSLQGVIIILASIVITTLGVMIKSEGKDIGMGNDFINGGLSLVPCYFMLVLVISLVGY